MHHIITITPPSQYVITLEKANKKGSQWSASKRTYLFRITLPNGEYKRIYPEDYGKWEGTKFIPREGKSVVQITNDVMLGGPTGEMNKTTGMPIVKDGLLRRYEVVSKEQYRNAQTLGERNPYIHNRDGSPKEMLGRETLTSTVKGPDGKPVERDWYVFAYSKSPVVERDKDGKPVRYAGYADLGPHASLITHHAFKEHRLSQKILEHKIGESELTGKPQLDGPEKLKLTPDQERKAAYYTATPAVAGDSMRNKPVPTEDTAQALGLTVTDETDPLDLARQLLARNLYGKKAKRPEGAARRLTNFPSWVVAKFKDEQELIDHLQNKPATFMVTTGIFKPASTTNKFNKRLMEEWAPVIYRMCRHDADALKATKTYEAWRAKDQERGIDSTHPESAVRNYVLQASSDLASAGKELFLKISQSYQWSTESKDRFDRYAYVTVNNKIKTLSAAWASEQGTLDPIVHETQIDDAANRQRQSAPLTPQEMAELHRVTPVARAGLARVFNDQNTPEAYTRIIGAHLFLDDLVLERQRIDERAAERDIVATEAEAKGVSVKRVERREGTWRRNFTGKDSIAAQYPVWTDPHTGATVDISKLSQKQQFRKLSQWYEEAVDRVKRDLAVPLAQGRSVMPEAEWHTGRIETIAHPHEYSAEEKLTYAALGKPKKVPLVLTNEGRAVMRYLQLEGRLADTAHRRWTGATDPLEEDRSLDPTKRARPAYKTPEQRFHGQAKPKSSSIKHVLIVPPTSPTSTAQHSANPAVTFFAAAPNQHLAQRLGLQLRRISDPLGTHYVMGAKPGQLAPNVSDGVYAQPNVSIGKFAQRELDAAQRHYDRVMAYRKVASATLAKEHETYTAVHKLLTSFASPKGEVAALARAATAFHAAKVSVAYLDEQRRTRRRELDTVKLTAAEVKRKLTSVTLSPKDKQKLTDVAAKYDAALEAVKRVSPAVASVYEQAIAAKDVGDHTHASAQAALRQTMTALRHKLALIDFETQRRATLKSMKKALVDADELVEALHAYSFAVGRLVARVA